VDDPKQILKKLLTGQNVVKFLSCQKPCNLSQPSLTKFNVDEVLSLFFDTNMSKHQYLLIRNFVNSKTSFNLLPSYEKLLAAKASSYPESQAEVELQSLLDHTALRIVKLQADVLESISDESVADFILIGKWGFDVSTLNNNIDDSNLFVTSNNKITIPRNTK